MHRKGDAIVEIGTWLVDSNTGKETATVGSQAAATEFHIGITNHSPYHGVAWTELEARARLVQFKIAGARLHHDRKGSDWKLKSIGRPLPAHGHLPQSMFRGFWNQVIGVTVWQQELLSPVTKARAVGSGRGVCKIDAVVTYTSSGAHRLPITDTFRI